jgi:hypothetical protein
MGNMTQVAVYLSKSSSKCNSARGIDDIEEKSAANGEGRQCKEIEI